MPDKAQLDGLVDVEQEGSLGEQGVAYGMGWEAGSIGKKQVSRVATCPSFAVMVFLFGSL